MDAAISILRQNRDAAAARAKELAAEHQSAIEAGRRAQQAVDLAAREVTQLTEAIAVLEADIRSREHVIDE